MTFYLLILTLSAGPGFLKPFDMPLEARLDTLLDNTPAYRMAVPVDSPGQAAVRVLARNRTTLPGREVWSGELYQVDLAARSLRPLRLPKISSSSDTLREEFRQLVR